jgi:hypothetical protein
MMPVSTVEIVYDQGNPRNVLYRGLIDGGGTIDYGPVVTIDPDFDAEALIPYVQATMDELLAEQEIESILSLVPGTA